MFEGIYYYIATFIVFATRISDKRRIIPEHSLMHVVILAVSSLIYSTVCPSGTPKVMSSVYLCLQYNHHFVMQQQITDCLISNSTLPDNKA